MKVDTGTSAGLKFSKKSAAICLAFARAKSSARRRNPHSKLINPAFPPWAVVLMHRLRSTAKARR